MLGAIIGDIVGSTREWNNIKREDFELVPQDSRFTDDTVMTLAVAEWLMTDPTHGESSLVKCMQELGRKYPNAGYGGMFRRWLRTESPQPYGSFGNGSDYGTPHSIKETRNLLQKIEELRDKEGYIYIHSRKGSGRTGTIVACMSAQWQENPKIEQEKEKLRQRFSQMPKSAFRETPDTEEQSDFIAKFIEDHIKIHKENKNQTRDRIRGCLAGGAAGDALGYPVEFMSRKNILAHYGKMGIQVFETDEKGKALVSDDTQMTLFTANGILMGLTRTYMRGIGNSPEKYVDGAYLDWYYTQTGRKKIYFTNDWHYTWLRDLFIFSLADSGFSCIFYTFAFGKRIS